MKKEQNSYRMNTKPLKLISTITFLFLFCINGFVYGQEPEVKREYWDNGNLSIEEHYKDGKEMVFRLSGIKTERKNLRHIIKMGNQMVYWRCGMKTERRGMKYITKMEKKMVLRLSGMKME